MAGSALLLSAAGPGAESTRAADPNTVNFVRPGLAVKITGADIASDGTIRVRVKVTDLKGLPLDREGVATPGSVSLSFIAAYIPKGQKQYVAYTTRAQKSPITGVTADQAGTDSGGVFDKVGDGDYMYTFATKAPKSIDRNATHTIGFYASRSLTEFDLGTQYADGVYNFVPDGSPVKTVRDVVRTAACNQCHHTNGFHGGPRKSVEVCILCHQPQSVDPDTGNSVDLVVMTHKIHMGANLPSVKAGKKYQIIGHSQTVADYSDVNFPADARNCAACHDGKASQADNLFQPNRTACGSCHDDVNFATGANHVNLPQRDDGQCAGCHNKRGELEFDASILGAHTIPRFSNTLAGVVLDIVSVEGGAAGKSPKVTFTIKDKKGNPIPIASMARANLVLAGPSSDYGFYVSENALTATTVAEGRYAYTFKAAIPAGVRGSFSVGIEARRDAKLLPGTKKEQTIRESGANKVFYFSVDNGPVQKRRTVVSIDKCNVCHFSLSLHGDNRNATEQCVLCHNPTMTSGTGNDATAISFGVMVHRIHTGAELERPYKLGSTSFNEVGYPGDRRNCAACHVNGSEQLPLKPGLLVVQDGPTSPALGPTGAACTGCHSSRQAATHAAQNTNKFGEACAVCHGPTSESSVSKVHAQ